MNNEINEDDKSNHEDQKMKIINLNGKKMIDDMKNDPDPKFQQSKYLEFLKNSENGTKTDKKFVNKVCKNIS